ncbi:MAG: hypothetical protein ACKVS6_01540 [Planctomycetota bacterium]
MKPLLTILSCSLLVCACSTARTGSRAVPPVTDPGDPPATTEWHHEPVLERFAGKNVILFNRADRSFEASKIVELLQTQFDYIQQYVGAGPAWIYCHVGAKYPVGFSMHQGAPGEPPHPEMFLQSGGIFDTQNNYAHEMMHCFNSYFGHLPHWFNESSADLIYFESEVYLYGRRRELELLKSFDRVDHRSYELMQLRARFGPDFFPKAYRLLLGRLAECRATFNNNTELETQNRFLISILSQAAGQDLLPIFQQEFGFSVKTRERQRGY